MNLLFLVVVIALAIGIPILAGRAKNPALRLAKGEKLLGQGNHNAARKEYTRAVALAEAGRGKAGERAHIIGHASLRLGELERSAGNRASSFRARRFA
jgi:hypothetical protein